MPIHLAYRPPQQPSRRIAATRCLAVAGLAAMLGLFYQVSHEALAALRPVPLHAIPVVTTLAPAGVGSAIGPALLDCEPAEQEEDAPGSAVTGECALGAFNGVATWRLRGELGGTPH